MNKTELNQKFEKLNAQVNALWDSSKSLQDQSSEWKQAWQARFEVSRDLRNFRSLGGDKCRLHDKAFKLAEQSA